MRNLYKYASIVLVILATIYACDPAEDRLDITGNVDKAKLSYTHKQLDALSMGENSGGNLVNFNLTSDAALVVWRAFASSNNALIAMGNEKNDTLDLPFKGEYLIKVYASFREGPVTDSFKITTNQVNPKSFANPYWNLLTNGSAGKYWVIKAKYVGPESDFKTNWFQPSIATETWGNDSIYFDLNFGYNYRHYHGGTIKTNIFNMNTDNFAKGPYVVGFGSADITMPNDDKAEMSNANANRFRIHKLTNDTLIVGQGASLTAARQSEDWSWYWIYVRSDM